MARPTASAGDEGGGVAMGQQEPRRDLDSGRADAANLQDKKVRRQKGLHRYWVEAPTTLKVLTGLAAFGG